MGKCAVPADHPLAAGLPWHRATSDLTEHGELLFAAVRRGRRPAGHRLSLHASSPRKLEHAFAAVARRRSTWTPPRSAGTTRWPPVSVRTPASTLEALAGRVAAQAASALGRAAAARASTGGCRGLDFADAAAPGPAARRHCRGRHHAAGLHPACRVPGLRAAHLPAPGRFCGDGPRHCPLPWEPRPPSRTGPSWPSRGDGCFQMTGMELATAVQESLPVVIVLVNDGSPDAHQGDSAATLRRTLPWRRSPEPGFWHVRASVRRAVLRAPRTNHLSRSRCARPWLRRRRRLIELRVACMM